MRLKKFVVTAEQRYRWLEEVRAYDKEEAYDKAFLVESDILTEGNLFGKRRIANIKEVK